MFKTISLGGRVLFYHAEYRALPPELGEDFMDKSESNPIVLLSLLQGAVAVLLGEIQVVHTYVKAVSPSGLWDSYTNESFPLWLLIAALPSVSTTALILLLNGNRFDLVRCALSCIALIVLGAGTYLCIQGLNEPSHVGGMIFYFGWMIEFGLLAAIWASKSASLCVGHLLVYALSLALGVAMESGMSWWWALAILLISLGTILWFPIRKFRQLSSSS